MNRRVIPVECGGCWAEAVGVRPVRPVRPVQVVQVRRASYARDWRLFVWGVASLGHCSSRLLGDPFSSVLTEAQPFLTEFLTFLKFLAFLPFSNGRYFRIGLLARG